MLLLLLLSRFSCVWLFEIPWTAPGQDFLSIPNSQSLLKLMSIVSVTGVQTCALPISRSNQSILKEINPKYSLEGLMLKLKLQYFGHLMWRADSFEKTLMLGKIGAGGEGDDRGWDGWMTSLTQWTWVWVDSRSWWWTGRAGVLGFMGLQSQTRLSNWTETNRDFHRDT